MLTDYSFADAVARARLSTLVIASTRSAPDPPVATWRIRPVPTPLPARVLRIGRVDTVAERVCHQQRVARLEVGFRTEVQDVNRRAIERLAADICGIARHTGETQTILQRSAAPPSATAIAGRR